MSRSLACILDLVTHSGPRPNPVPREGAILCTDDDATDGGGGSAGGVDMGIEDDESRTLPLDAYWEGGVDSLDFVSLW